MSATLNGYGYVPRNHPSGEIRAFPYSIAAAYGTAISKYQPVILNTNGTITAGAAASDLLGVLSGVEYTDSTGKRVVNNSWPAGGVTGATNITAWVWDDPLTEYSVQADGSLAQTAVGDQADISNATAAGNGMSQATLSASLAGVGVQGQFRITAIDPSIDNAVGDAFTKAVVTIARHQFIANKVAI